MDGQDHTIATTAALESLYSDAPYGPALIKETDHVTAEYRKLIEAAPFVVLATNGPEGLDCSPRGDPPGFVRVVDPRIALLFLIPGVGETMRIIGRAKLSTDPKLTETFAINGKLPKCVLVVTVERAYFQCTKAIIRSKLWDPASKVDRKTLPTPGSILAELTEGKMGGPEHDRLAPERIKETIY
jgi:predicted pyridoxine 5'-phosphate oxidase superfamily flavin-nucleotide-binding protein